MTFFSGNEYYVQVFSVLADGNWHPINRFNLATLLCLPQAKFWISRVFFVFNGLKRGDVVRFVDIDEIVDHHCLNIFPIIPHAIITCL
jgi:hypothetical protein